MRKSARLRYRPLKWDSSSSFSVRLPAPGTPRSPQERPPEEEGSVSIRAPRDPAVRSLLVPTRTGLLPLTPRGNGWHLLEPEFFVDDEVSAGAGPHSRLYSSAYRIDCTCTLDERGLSLKMSRANTHSEHTNLSIRTENRDHQLRYMFGRRKRPHRRRAYRHTDLPAQSTIGPGLCTGWVAVSQRLGKCTPRSGCSQVVHA